MNELVIKIKEDGAVAIEEVRDGIKSFKAITPDSLLACINSSLLRGSISSGLLPRGCLSYTAHDSGDKEVCILHQESKADITYHGSSYPNFPLPKLVFGFHISKEGRISRCRLGVVGNENNLKPTTSIFVYPFSNVGNNGWICTGNNVLPKCQSFHTLGSVPYYILSMDNNDDHFRHENNKRGLGMRDLLALLQDKAPEYYYSDILIPSKTTLGDFINGRGVC